MPPPVVHALVVLGLGAVVVLVLVIRWFGHGLRRKRVARADFPKAWREILKRNVPLYHRLPERLQRELEGHTLVFLAEKDFEGCAGLEITDEIRVTIAAQSCVLLLNRRTDYYPGLQTILVYPHAYFAKEGPREDGTWSEEETGRLGESWDAKTVVLAWDHARQDSRDIHDGHNVVLHEFAHQLDQQSGVANGVPILDQNTSYVAWGRVMSEEYERLRRRVRKHMGSVLDAYGATNPAEFFAVATETFFEKPDRLKQHEPELYEELRLYYHLDPLEWNARR